MTTAVPDAEVTGYRDLIPALGAFGDDAHVVAAAIRGNVDVIVTSNLADFPAADLRQYNLTAQSPDDFLVAQWDLKPEVIREALKEQSAALRNPPMDVLEILTSLENTVPNFARAVMESFGQVHT